MLSQLEIHATIPASDLERARRFYEEKLGLHPTEETPV
jgi:catechol 2,3-dioxygenase-like lactoylglutathione lyase family enzyme